MQIKAQISFEYQTTKQAKIALNSLKPDNMDFLDSYNHENILICNLNGGSLKTILATADDILFCEMMVEKVLELE
jgi:hypothetical protein